MRSKMSLLRLAAFLCLINASLGSERPPLDASLGSDRPLLDASLGSERPPLDASLGSERPPLDASLGSERPPLDASLGSDRPPLDASLGSDRPPLLTALDQVLDAVLDVAVPDSVVLGDSACRRQGRLYRRAIKEGQAWALHMLDACAKLPSGLMLHNLVQLGNFDECLAVRHEDPDLGVVEGQHCQVSFGPVNSMSALGMVQKAEAGGINFKHFKHFNALVQKGQLLSAFRLVGGSWAVCVPAACSAAQLQLHLRTALPWLPIRVDAHACTTGADAGPDWDWHAVVALALLSMLLALLAVGTTLDLVTSESPAPPRLHPLVAFSLVNNTRLLFGEHAPRSDALPSLHGIRCLATLLVVLGHFYVMYLGAPLANIVYVLDHVMDVTRMPSSHATVYVDTFLVMSGILLAYSYIAQRERKKDFSLGRFYLNRYLRIAPAHLFAVLVGVASLPFTHWLVNAPLVKANLAPLKANCTNLRWLSLLYVSNYLDKDHYCTGVSWYLSIEMQLLLLSPLVLLPLWRTPRLGLTLLGLLSLVGTGWVFAIAYEHRLHVVSVISEVLPSANLDHVYFYTHTRLVSWLLGLAVGALLSRRIAPSRRQAALGWCVCALLVYYAMFHAHASFQPDFVPRRLHSALYFATMRPAWALASAWLVFACETGNGGLLHTALSWSGWQFFSRLSYGVFLSHFAIVSSFPAGAMTARHPTDLSSLTEYCGVVVVSLIAATALHLCVEMPVYILYQIYQSKASAVSSRTKRD